MGAAAAWESKTDCKQQALKHRFEIFKANRDAELEARRNRLAAKLHAEEQQLKQELLSSQESPAERRAKVAARAREMARKREAERQKMAAQLAEQAFRDNCDPLRERQSRQITYRTAQEREQQVSKAFTGMMTHSSLQWLAFIQLDEPC